MIGAETARRRMEEGRTYVLTRLEQLLYNISEPPASKIWLQDVDPLHRHCLFVSLLFLVVCLLLLFLQFYYISSFVSSAQIRHNLYFIILMAPLTCVNCFIGMTIPRSAVFVYSVITSYFLVCYYVIVRMMVVMCGGRKALSSHLRRLGRRIKLYVFPLCCIKACVPSPEPTEKSLRVLEWLVLQTVCVRLLLAFLDVVAHFDPQLFTTTWVIASQSVGISSMLVAFFSFYIMVPLGKTRLSRYRFSFIFHVIDFAQGLVTSQRALFWALAVFEVIEPFHNNSVTMDSATHSMFFFLLCLSGEMVFLSLLSTLWMRPSRTVLFDLYRQQTVKEEVESDRLNSTEKYWATDVPMENLSSDSSSHSSRSNKRSKNDVNE